MHKTAKEFRRNVKNKEGMRRTDQNNLRMPRVHSAACRLTGAISYKECSRSCQTQPLDLSWRRHRSLVLFVQGQHKVRCYSTNFVTNLLSVS